MDQEFKTVDPSTTFTSASKPYVAAPTKKLLKFHVGQLETTEQINNFKTTPDGKENPDYGKPQPVLIFKGVLDEGEAAGQSYSSWITGYYKDGQPVYSMGDRSKLGKIDEALGGVFAGGTPAGEIEGLPFQCALVPGKKNPEKLLLDIDKIMPAADDQVRVELSAKQIDELPTDEALEDELTKAIENAG